MLLNGEDSFMDNDSSELTRQFHRSGILIANSNLRPISLISPCLRRSRISCIDVAVPFYDMNKCDFRGML